jgi:hypothetical protein
MSTEKFNEIRVRNRIPTLRQKRALEAYMVANGKKTKAEALRNAGYSEAVVRHPSRVFGREAFVRHLNKTGMLDIDGVEVLLSGACATKPFVMSFDGCGVGEAEEDGEQMTDNEIKEYLAGFQIVVTEIIHTKNKRIAHGIAPDWVLQLKTADMIFKLFGSYAPKKMISKNERRVGIRSMKELRESIKNRAGIYQSDINEKG